MIALRGCIENDVYVYVELYLIENQPVQLVILTAVSSVFIEMD